MKAQIKNERAEIVEARKHHPQQSITSISHQLSRCGCFIFFDKISDVENSLLYASRRRIMNLGRKSPVDRGERDYPETE